MAKKFIALDLSTSDKHLTDISVADIADLPAISDEKVKVDADDTAGYLEDKITSTDESVTITNTGTALDLSVVIPETTEAVNIETLTGDKTLTAADAPIQMLSTGGANRYVYLPTTGLANGQKFEIFHKEENSSYHLRIYIDAINYTKIQTQQKKVFRWDGSVWVVDNEKNISIGSVDANSGYGIGIGNNTTPYTFGIAIGDGAEGYSYGVGIGKEAYGGQGGGTAVGYQSNGRNNGSGLGRSAIGYTYGVGVGYGAVGHTYGVGVGCYTINNNNYATGVGYYATCNSKQTNTVALGAYSKAERNRELVSTATDSTTNKAQLTWQKYKDITFVNNTDTPLELYIDGSSARLVILNNSVYSFTGECNVIVASVGAKTGCAKSWQFSGVIRRKNVGTITYTENFNTVVFNDQAECPELSLIGFTLTADETNYSLKPTITKGVGTEELTFRVSLNIRATEIRV